MLRFFDRVLDAPVRLATGTLRAATIDATWRRFAPAARRAGITRLAELTGLDTLGIPVFAAIRPLGRSLSTQQGKGLTPDAARVSALMESLETYTAERATGTVTGSYRALAKRRRVADVRHLPRPRGKLDLDARWRWIEGFVTLRLREPGLGVDDPAEIHTVYVSRDDPGDDVTDLAVYLQDLVQKYFKEKPNF